MYLDHLILISSVSCLKSLEEMHPYVTAYALAVLGTSLHKTLTDRLSPPPLTSKIFSSAVC